MMNFWPAPNRAHARAEVARAQMELVIAEVSTTVNAAADKRMAEGRRMAEAIRDFAASAREVMDVNRTWMPTGQFVVIEYRCLEAFSMIMQPFNEAHAAFEREHAGLLEQDARDTIERFDKWVSERLMAVRPLWTNYLKSYEEGLRASADEQRKLAAEWSAVDGDGLDSKGKDGAKRRRR